LGVKEKMVSERLIMKRDAEASDFKGAIMAGPGRGKYARSDAKIIIKDKLMPKTNYQYEKRQKELDKKKKKAEKEKLKELRKITKLEENPTTVQEKEK
jgi:hypothetical protein